MNELERVSVIMAAYNAEKTIAQAIESVLTQSYTELELIVVDDCSCDGTKAVVDKYAKKDGRVKLICNEKNSGVSITRGNALKVASGEWVAVLDSDDFWLPDKLEKQFKLQKETGAKLLYTGSAFMDQDGNRKDWIMHVPTTVSYRQLLKQNVLSNSSSLCRKELFEKHYARGDGMHEDFALWLRILKSGETACGVDEPLLVYRLSASSKSGNKLKAAKMNWRTYRYVGLNFVEALYYEFFYMVNGVLKHMNLS